MAKSKKRSKILETKFFGLIIGFIIFGIFFFISYSTHIIDNIEQDFFLDIYFNYKHGFTSESLSGGTTYEDTTDRYTFTSKDIQIIGIDIESLNKFGSWPFPRSVEASMINTITRIQNEYERESVLYFDIAFIEPDIKMPENDLMLIESIKENGKVFLDVFLSGTELSGALDQFSRQDILKSNYGEITNISGDINSMPAFRGLEAPLKPYSEVIKGYGNATYLKDVDNIYRRQIMIARLSEQLETIKFSDLTPGYELDADNFERLVWIDKSRNIKSIEYPLTSEYLIKLESEIEKNGNLVEKDTDGDGNTESFYEIYKYRDHFIPSITLSLALEYYKLTPSDVEVKMGEDIRLIGPKVLTSAPVYEKQQDQNGNTIKNDAGIPVYELISEPEYSKIDDVIIPIDNKGAMLINYAGPRSEVGESNQTFNVMEFNGYVSDPGPNPETWKPTYVLTNKIIMIGIFATGLAEDEKPTPFGLMYGVEINANALNTILMNRFLVYAPVWVSSLILFGIILIVSFMSSRLSTIWALVITLIFLAVFFIVVVFIFDFYNFILIFSAPFFASILTFLCIVAYRVMTEERAKKRIKNMFGKYVNPTVVEQMMTSPPELGGVDKDLTVFFSDIRGFTTLSENMAPQLLVNHLNHYLTVMTDIIMEYNGTLDKYVGDEIMCFWGAPIPQANHAILSCKCAIKQMQALRELNKNWPPEKRINIGIGLNSGIMTVGNMGSQGRMNYTLMGDNVNLGARLEGTNKQYKTNIIISEHTYGIVKDRVIARELDNIRVKGKNKPVLIYELLDIIEGLEP